MDESRDTQVEHATSQQATTIMEVVNHLRTILSKLEQLALSMNISAALAPPPRRVTGISGEGIETENDQEDIQNQINRAIKEVQGQEQEKRGARVVKAVGPGRRRSVVKGVEGVKEVKTS
jgi:hypothetical protein